MDAAAPSHEVEAVAFAVAGVCALLGTSAMLAPAAKRLALPYTVLVAVFGAAIGAFLTVAPQLGGMAAAAAALFAETELPSDALLYLFLPPLLFASGIHIDLRRLLDDIWSVVLLAVVAVLVCCIVVGAATVGFMNADGVSVIGGPEWRELLLLALLLGAVVAPTDTAAILSIFKDIGAPRRLATIVEGESLFNDAAAIALVVVLIAALGGDTSGGFVGAGFAFLKQLGGGLAFGWAAGAVAARAIVLARGFVVAETSLTLALAYVTFAVAQLLLDVSGIIAVVAAAITFAALVRTRISAGSWDALLTLWKQLDFWATTLIFVFAAMTAPEVLATLRWTDLAALGVIYVATLAARALMTFVAMPALARLGLSEPFSKSYRVALAWGGVRGALTVVLALFVTQSAAVAATGAGNARLILVLAFGYVLMTLAINATTLRVVMRALKLHLLSRREQVVRDRVMALSRERIETEIRDVARRFGLEREKPTHAVTSASTLSPEERLQVALLILTNRETELIMRALDRGLIGRDVADIALAQNGRMFDAARERGAVGYREAMRRNQAFTAWFRIALFLHRRFGMRRPLASAISSRFELMLSKQRAVEQLIDFAKENLPFVIGEKALDEIVSLLKERVLELKEIVAGMERQYPAYATMVREYLVERIALSLEEAEYRAQRQHGLISEEIFDDLEADRLSRVRALSRRPPLDLGLEISGMIARVPLFEGLDEDELAEIARLLKPELAVQRERVIRAGAVGREMYFIASGQVEIVSADGRTRLGDGEFFGEVALLTAQPRNADVIALTYCELLVLKREDLDRVVSRRPELRAQMTARAAARANGALTPPARPEGPA